MSLRTLRMRCALFSATSTYPLRMSSSLTPSKPNTLYCLVADLRIHSSAASLFRRGPRLPWSRYLDRCCEALEKAREYETDLHIVALARLHRTADHIHTIFKPDGAADLPKYLRAPVFMAIERIQAELKSIIDAYPASEQVRKLTSGPNCRRSSG